MKTTERFSSRVENYVKYRPGYPAEVVTRLEELGILKKDFVIVDIGSGTGISAKIFLERGYSVAGVEPNREMRLAGETFLAAFGNFKSLDATAEATTLADQSRS